MEKSTQTEAGPQVQKAAPAPEASLYEEMDRLLDDFFLAAGCVPGAGNARRAAGSRAP